MCSGGGQSSSNGFYGNQPASGYRPSSGGMFDLYGGGSQGMPQQGGMNGLFGMSDNGGQANPFAYGGYGNKMGQMSGRMQMGKPQPDQMRGLMQAFLGQQGGQMPNVPQPQMPRIPQMQSQWNGGY